MYASRKQSRASTFESKSVREKTTCMHLTSKLHPTTSLWHKLHVPTSQLLGSMERTLERFSKDPEHRVDGSCPEQGSSWAGLLMANSFRLENLRSFWKLFLQDIYALICCCSEQQFRVKCSGHHL